MPLLRKTGSGFTLIETLIAIGILGIFFAAISMILQNVLGYLTRARIRTTALSLAQSKMEGILTLPYSGIGTIGGIPAGSLLSTENVTVNNLIFTVATSVVYIDDPYDGVTPADAINTDYKRARVSVTWGGAFPSITPLALVTNISPKNIESTPAGGTIQIHVYNSYGQPVPGAKVNIDNTAVTPPVHTNDLTDSAGIVNIPGSPACTACYQITVTKKDYSSDRTYTTSEVANPVSPDATVLDGNLTQISFSIDAVSNITINSYNSTYAPVANVQFTIRGAKIIGYDSNDLPVYKYQYSTNTGGFTVSIPNLEWDTYDLDLTSSAWTLAGSNPIVPAPISAGTQTTIPIVVVPKSQASLLVIAKDPLNRPLASASARLVNTTLGFDTTKFTHATGSSDFGQTIFNNLTTGIYDLSVTMPDYTEATASLNITTNIRKTMLLQPL